MKPKAAGLLMKFESIKTHARDVLSSLKSFEKIRLEAQQTLLPYKIIEEVESLEWDKVKETQMILDEYLRSSSDVHNVLGMTLQHLSPPSKVGDAKGTLRQIFIECDNVIGALRSLAIPLSPEDMDKLSKLRSEIANVVTKLDVNYEKNLNEAIDEYEKGHNLASTLIAGRVIVYVLDQIEGKTEEEKIKFLQDKGVIQRNRKDIREFIIKASKKARHFLAHDINIFADSSDALSILGDSVKLLGIFAKLKG